MSTSSNKKNQNLQLTSTKKTILQYLHDNIQITDKFQTIKNLNELDIIKNNDYIVCPRLNGNRIWIVFFEYKKNYYAVNFPKYQKKKNIDDLIIHPIDISVKKAFYRGTIMEGIYFKAENEKYLIIDEVYILSGEDQLLKSKWDRLNDLTQYVKSSIIDNPYYHMYVSYFYHINKKNLRDLYEKIKSNPNICEIIFYPNIYGGKIYTYSIMDEDLVDNVIKISKFILQKTNNPDVYNLLSIHTKTKIGIAYIPDIETSKKCKQWFKDYKRKELVVSCQLNINKKWIPMEVIDTTISVSHESVN